MPATIKQNLDAIKEAVYGEEVRTAIHDSIEQCYEDTSKGKTLAEGAADRANTAASNADTARRNAQAVVDGAVTAINDAAAQQRQSVNNLGDQLKDYLEDHYGETTDKVAAKANRSSISTVKHAIGADSQLTLTDALNEPAKKMTIHLEPKQDLHGYDHPWVGGSGKNLCASSVKSETAFGLTIKLNEDGTFLVSGTYQRDTTTEYFENNSFTLPAGTYILSGTPYNNLGYQLRVKSGATTLCSGNNTFTLSASTTVLVVLYVPYSSSGKALPASGFLFEPMIRLATVTNPTYEPYSNICPIEGFDSINVTSVGKNLFPSNWETGTIDTSGNPLDTDTSYYRVQKIKVEPDCNYFLSFNGIAPGASSSAFRYFLYNADGSFANVFAAIAGPQSITTGTDTGYISFRWHKELALTDIQLEKGSVATSYEPFGQSLSLNLVSSAGSTVYGGTVTVNEDGSGTLVVDKGLVTIDNFLNLSSAVQVSGLHWADTTQNVFDINVDGESICSMLADRKDGNAGWGSKTDCFALGTPGLRIYTTETTNAAFREKYKDVQITYTFNTPLVYHLTAAQLHTIAGTNHILTDGTSLELDYHADKYGLVDRLLAAFPKDTATGNPATFTDGADGLPVERLEVAIEPKQDLHGYDRPWVGGAGKNLLHSFTNKSFSVTGITISTLDDGSLWTAGKATDVVEASFIRVPRDTTKTYFINGCPSGGSTSTYRIIVRMFEGNLMVGTLSDIGNGLIIAPSEQPTATEMRIGIWFNNGYTTTGMNFKPMVIVGSSAEPYEPHENICPITGWDAIWLGENLYHKSNVLLGKNWINQTAVNRASIFFDIKKGVKYHYQFLYKGNKNIGIVYGENSATGQAQTFAWNTGMSVSTINDHITTNTKAFFQFQWNDGGMTDPIQWSDINDWEIVVSEVSENATAQTIPVKSIAGSTVYGGKLTIKEDGSGELTVDHYKVVLTGVENWKTNTVATGLYYLENTPYQLIKENGQIISDEFAVTNVAGSLMSVGQMKISGTNVNFKTQYATVNDWKNSLSANNVTICYEMASPVTYSFTAHQVTTLLGTNHISCDAGEVTVTYHADPTLFITKKIAQALNA